VAQERAETSNAPDRAPQPAQRQRHEPGVGDGDAGEPGQQKAHRSIEMDPAQMGEKGISGF
jgi:hypothetical protein